ncbi:MAG: Sec-independent protein translocase protein TatB [Novosphingopyxis baekryungensis]|jgi:sec-independent protein translocase protein TatB|nr:Sec-independent protein translocase protein TatB [Novosphingopyxis baekryungensis]
MFDLGISEMAVIAVIAVVAIGPKQLPEAMMTAGRWVARIRGVMRQVREGFDDMVREAELKDMEKKWADENARIMREHPEGALTSDDLAAAEAQMRPLPPPAAAADPADREPPPADRDPPPADHAPAAPADHGLADDTKDAPTP